MQHQLTPTENNIIIIDSLMDRIPMVNNEEEQKILAGLLEIIKGIAQKYTIDKVEARYNKLSPDQVSIVFSGGKFLPAGTSMWVRGEAEYERPMRLLASYGAIIKSEERVAGRYFPNTLLTINRSNFEKNIQNIIQELKREIPSRDAADLHRGSLLIMK